MNLEEIINSNSIFICGEDEKLTQLAIDVLLVYECRHIYLENPPSKVLSYLQKVTDASRFSTITNLQSLKAKDLKQHDLILCGLKLAADMKIISKHPGTVYAFFNQKVGMFRSLWERLRINNLQIYENSFSDFLQKSYPSEEEHALEVVDTEDIFFTNRGKSFDQHRKFISNPTLRCCLILGLSGIGKRSFIRQLKLSQGLNENCFEITFFSKHDDITFLLERLFKMMGLPFDQEDIERVEFDRKIFKVVLEALFKGFDSKNARIIFYDFHLIFDNKNKNFYNRNIGVFFEKILARESYSGNKLYIVSNESFVFPKLASRDFTCEILLPPLHAKQIQLILEYEFNSRLNNQLGIAIMQYSYDVIDSLANGHPQIAKLLVEVCDSYPLDSLVNDDNFRKKFDQAKVAYLMERIRLEREDFMLLAYLSLFRVNFSIDAITAKPLTSEKSIEILRRKFLLEKQDFSDGSCRYYVPDVIKSCATGQISINEIKENHSIIGNYYWDKADSNLSNSADVLTYYRLALYHFESSANHEKLNHLVVYFKGVFLNHAREFYSRRNWSESLQYFEQVSNHSKLEGADLIKLLNCKSKLKKSDAEYLFCEAEESYSKNDFFLACYAEHHARNLNYEKALLYCEKALEINDYSVSANSTYPRVISVINGRQEAVNWLDKRIEKFKNSIDRQSRLLVVCYMNLYSALGFQDTLKQVFYDITYMLKCMDLFTDKALEVKPNISEEKMNQVIALFDKSLKIWSKNLQFYYIYPAKNLSVIEVYANYLVEHNKTEEAKKVLSIPTRDPEHKVEWDQLRDAEWENIVESSQHLEEDDFYERYPGLQDCLGGLSLEAISLEAGKLVINAILGYCERIMQDSYDALSACAKIEPRNFEVSYALAHLMSRYEKVEYIREVVKYCVNQTATQAPANSPENLSQNDKGQTLFVEIDKGLYTMPNYLKATLKAVKTFAGPLAAPAEFVLSLYEDEEAQKQVDELDKVIAQRQELSPDVLEHLIQTRSELTQFREQFLIGMKVCLSILARHRDQLSSPEAIEQNMPHFLADEREALEEQGFITKQLLSKDISRLYASDPNLFIAIVSDAGFPVQTLPNRDAMKVIASRFLDRCEGLELKQQSRIFTELSDENPGVESLRKVSGLLREMYLYQTP